ncbi:putative LLM family oxidoreductase [Arthrobacter sp. PvP102]|uniref:LLM class flavin-dependent oxidoreductase n=1 Tax=unclassified Arthrobacter TaxID=235627 RepID=UPI001B662526|nr:MULTISPECIES: LLM class flavin-dependent oxidoreductase [unclassified Arthrobacter]MBP1232072.1 putative LLM family oxidoreductase [Arthrobacter sp. PvP103]MBP1237207.1 putative LLM family oxidoreductase [Arthrobacter sp. PvP102]
MSEASGTGDAGPLAPAAAPAHSPTAPVGPGKVLLGLNTFGDVGVYPDGHPVPHAQVLRQLLEQAELADDVGLHAFGVGEHHRKDYAVSAPEVFLAAAAARTKRIRLGSAVTVLSSDDPIRVFQRFSTVDAISSGRAEVMLGRGSFIESFPLFGLDLADYEILFEEKLELFDKVRAQKPVHWEGRTRPAVNGLSVYPPLEHHLLPAWIGVGGTPESVLRCAQYGYPIIFAIIGGEPRSFAPLANLYREAMAKYGHPMQQVATHSPGHVAETDEEAREEFFPHWLGLRNRLGAERGWGPGSRHEFDAMCTPEGALYVGSAETVARKIVLLKRNLGVDRFDLKYSSGSLPHTAMMRSIELLGTAVAPRVAQLLSGHASGN